MSAAAKVPAYPAAIYAGTPAHPHRWYAAVVAEHPHARKVVWQSNGVYRTSAQAQAAAEAHPRKEKP